MQKKNIHGLLCNNTGKKKLSMPWSLSFVILLVMPQALITLEEKQKSFNESKRYHCGHPWGQRR